LALFVFSDDAHTSNTHPRKSCCNFELIFMYDVFMKSSPHPWELIFKKDGRVFTDPFPAFGDVAAEFTRRGCWSVLDLGCGSGRHTVALAQRGFQMVGLDISMSGLTQTRHWLTETGQSADLICADTRQRLPLINETFDAVFSTQVIHHALLANIRLAIAEIWRVLKPGGIAFVTVAGRKDDEKLLSEEIEPGTVVPGEGREKGLPHHLFTLEEARREFAIFKVKEVSARDGGKVVALWLEKPVDTGGRR
jgi:SAM-dependent methyltransferase